MKEEIRLAAGRLILRRFDESDIPEIVRLADDPDISRNTLLIPHPYEELHARRWMAVQKRERRTGKGLVFAVVLVSDRRLLGAVGLTIDREHNNAGLGYWIGREFWGRGYATEAARAVVGYGFEMLGLNKIHGGHFADNGASGRVMEKIGMTVEGYQPRHVLRGGKYRDLVLYGILREQWEGLGANRQDMGPSSY